VKRPPPVGISPKLLDKLSKLGIAAPNREQVLGYLSSYPDLTEVLAPLCKVVSDRFRDAAHLSLELYRDRESEDSYLTLYVRQAHYQPDLLEQLEDVSAEIGPLLRGSAGWLLVTTDFHSPR
jgi:hypothetical protein